MGAQYVGAYRGLTSGVRARERAKTGVKTGVTRAIGQKPLGWAEFWYKQVLSWRSVLCESINQSTEGESHAHKESIISAPLKKGFARTVLNFNTVQRSHKNQSIH